MYPTKEEILVKKPKFKKGTIHVVKAWKRNNIKGWKYKTAEEKFKALKSLIKGLEDVYENPVKEVIAGDDDMYDVKDKSIYITKDRPSIISALHEFGHHILGASELKACIFSVWLFKICFPGLYAKLEWSDHLLVKR